MVGCSAFNCANSSAKGYRQFRFLADEERRAKWIQNCRRDKWSPRDSSRLCEVHLEESQWETNRLDGWKKLKQSAIPTLMYPTLRNSNHREGGLSIKILHTNTDPEPGLRHFLSSTVSPMKSHFLKFCSVFDSLKRYPEFEEITKIFKLDFKK